MQHSRQDFFFCWQVVEGAQNTDHGVVYCRLCRRHNKSNTFALEGYQCGC